MVDQVFGLVACWTGGFCRLQRVETMRDVGESVLVWGHGEDEVLRVSSYG